MTLLRARVFDGALEHLMTTGTTWADGTIKARFTNDQAFDRAAALSSYTSVLGTEVTLANKAINVDTTNNFAALDADDVVSDVPGGGGSDADAVIFYRSTTNTPLFYLPFTNATIGAANTATVVFPSTGLFQFHGSVPALMKKYLQGYYDFTVGHDLTAFTVSSQPTATTMSTLTPTSDEKAVYAEYSVGNSTWAGGTFQIRMICDSFQLKVDSGLLHGIAIGDTTNDLLYAYIPLIRNIETDGTKVNCNVPAEGIFCVGGL